MGQTQLLKHRKQGVRRRQHVDLVGKVFELENRAVAKSKFLNNGIMILIKKKII